MGAAQNNCQALSSPPPSLSPSLSLSLSLHSLILNQAVSVRAAPPTACKEPDESRSTQDDSAGVGKQPGGDAEVVEAGGGGRLGVSRKES